MRDGEGIGVHDIKRACERCGMGAQLLPPSCPWSTHSTPSHLIVERLVVVSLSRHLPHLPSQHLVGERKAVFEPRSRINSFRYSFFVNIPFLWNTIPYDIVSSTSYAVFKYKLKSFLFG